MVAPAHRARCNLLWRPLGSRGAPLASQGVPLGSIWGAFGFPWGAFGLHLAPFGVHLAPLGVQLVAFGLHLAPFGVPFGRLWGALGALGAIGGSLGCLRAYSRFLSKLDIQFRANVSQVPRLHTKYCLAELIPGSRQSPGSPGSTQSVTWAAAPSPLHSRRGLG